MHSALFDSTTGEILTHGEAKEGCPRCMEALAAQVQAEADLQACERELRNLRRDNRRLRTELDKRERQSPNIRAAEALFRYWVVRLGKNAKTAVFGEKRRKVVLARLNEQSPEYIARAIDGLAVSFYTAPNGKRFDDLELVCRDEVKLEQFHDTAERVGAPTLVGPAWLREFGPSPENA